MKAFAGIMLVFFLGAMFVSLFNMAGDESDCPFMSHEDTWCPMDLADHIGAWHATFLAVSTSLVFLITVVGMVLLIIVFAPKKLLPRSRLLPILQRQLRERTYSFTERPLQELFAGGILHPKLF